MFHKLKIVFVKAYDFPLGGAPQNRALGICRGLIEEGHIVEIHQYAPAKLDLPQNHLKKQIYKSVPIYNHAWRWSPVKSKYHQAIGIIEGMIISLWSIFKSHRINRVDYIFFGAHKNIFIIPFFLLSKILGAKFGRDLNEYPTYVLSPDDYNWYQKKYKMLTNYRWYDVLFIMTKHLVNYYKPLLKKDAKTLLLPMTVDMDRFAHPSKELIHSKYITYCGDLSQSKDGVLSLIKSFAKIKDEFGEVKLKLIGENKDKEYIKSLKELICDLGLSDSVVLTGYIHPDKIPSELYNSRLLVLSRPNTVQAQGGFPTKLGEYLATGIPVAVTSVGEIPYYLKDGKNAFMTEPDDIEGFANAMRRALKDDELSLKIGSTGRETAIVHFSHRSQGYVTSNFLKNGMENK